MTQVLLKVSRGGRDYPNGLQLGWMDWRMGQVSDDSDKKLTQGLLTFADVEAFAREKIQNNFCPCCNNAEWTILFSRLQTEPEIVYACYSLAAGMPLPGQKNENHQTIPFGRPTIPFICTNCGYMRLHHYETIKTWVMQRGTVAVDG